LLCYYPRVIAPEDIDDSSPPSPSVPKSKPKAVSKAAAARKLLNKKIKINSHKKFDSDNSSAHSDDDEEAPELIDSLTPVPIENYTASSQVGGIEIGEARHTLQTRDKSDKQRERQRVKAVHKERRRKARGSTSVKAAILGGTSSESEGEEVKRIKLDEVGVASDDGLSGDEELALHLLAS